MDWFEQHIRRYEHRRWASEPDRRVLPFGWGVEHIGGSAAEPDQRGFLERFANETVAESQVWYATTPADDYRLEDGILTFTSAIVSPWVQNNMVYAQFFRAGASGPAIVVLPQWNAKPHEQTSVCRYLNFLGITALRLSLPYHDRRAIPGHPRADYLVGSNIGLTIQANRQAVMDVRRALRWLEQRGYAKLGLVGTSIGSSISFIAMAHDPAVRAGVFLHASTYFGDVVANGLTTSNVWESLRTKVTPEELRHYWTPISPFPYLVKMKAPKKRLLVIAGKYDPTFWPEFTEEFLSAIRANQVDCESLWLPCGHYSLGEPPFSWVAGGRFGAFLLQALG